jgi:hypothetical protein
MGLPKIDPPSTPKPVGATHYDSSHWYRDNGHDVWGGEWITCHWGDCDPLNHIRCIESGVKIPADWEERLNLTLVLETERAIKQRDAFLETGIVTAALGGSHDTCFAAIVRKFIAELE